MGDAWLRQAVAKLPRNQVLHCLASSGTGHLLCSTCAGRSAALPCTNGDRCSNCVCFPHTALSSHGSQSAWRSDTGWAQRSGSLLPCFLLLLSFLDMPRLLRKVFFV